MASILIVCTANVCRSPMAEGLLRTILQEQPRFGDWKVESAGTWVYEGQPASSRTLKVLRERGIDMSHHRARGINKELLQAFDLVFTMEKGHKEALLSEFPELAGRVFLISELVGSNKDIIDPMGGELADYEDTARELWKILNTSKDRIYEMGYRIGKLNS